MATTKPDISPIVTAAPTTDLAGLAAALKSSVAQSGTAVQFEEAKRGLSNKESAPAAVVQTAPVVTGAELEFPCRLGFNMMLTAMKLPHSTLPAQQIRNFADALAPVLNKYVPQSVDYAAEIALGLSAVGIGYTVYQAKLANAPDAEQTALEGME
jgi:hypothetical protein